MSCFFVTPSGTSLFLILCWSFAEKCDFGTPFKIQWVQNGTKNRPSGAKTSKIEITGLPKKAFLKQPCARDAAWSALGPIFHDFGRILDPSRPHFEGFSMTLGIASYIAFWYSPKSPDTRNTAELLQRSLRETSKEENWQETCRELAENQQETCKRCKEPSEN